MDFWKKMDWLRTQRGGDTSGMIPSPTHEEMSREFRRMTDETLREQFHEAVSCQPAFTVRALYVLDERLRRAEAKARIEEIERRLADSARQ
jgi:hypothetical protein